MYKRLREDFKHLGISQKELAGRLGTSPTMVCSTLNGNRGLTAKEVPGWALCLCMNEYTLMKMAKADFLKRAQERADKEYGE